MNEPAFPSVIDRFTYVPGMTMRQWYKGMAIQGLLNRQHLNVPVCPRCKKAGDDPGEHYAEIAGLYADALLAEDAASGKGEANE